MKRHLSLNNKPIGIFDSGLGGLTVLKALEKELPDESFIYFGDTAHLPYGTKSIQTILSYSNQIAEFLLKHDVKLIIIACNTASSIATTSLREKFSIPIFGVIKPCIKKAISFYRGGKIGIIGTESTISSNSYVNTFMQLSPKIEIIQRACPLFVPLIEENWINQPTTIEIAEIYLKIFEKKQLDALILGCTHYPIMESLIQQIIGDSVKLISSGPPIASHINKFLTKNKIKSDNKHTKTESFFVTDSPEKFTQLGSQFLGRKLTNISHIKI